MNKAHQFAIKLWKDESGISAVEYVVMLALVGSAIIFGAQTLGDAVGFQLDQAATCISTDGGTCP